MTNGNNIPKDPIVSSEDFKTKFKELLKENPKRNRTAIYREAREYAANCFYMISERQGDGKIREEKYYYNHYNEDFL